jgi:hypothetical protein
MSTPKTSTYRHLSFVSRPQQCGRRRGRRTKDDDPVHDPLGSPRNLLGRVGSFTGGQDDRLGTSVRVGGADECAAGRDNKNRISDCDREEAGGGRTLGRT